jgi:hypothetical protein
LNRLKNKVRDSPERALQLARSLLDVGDKKSIIGADEEQLPVVITPNSGDVNLILKFRFGRCEEAQVDGFAAQFAVGSGESRNRRLVAFFQTTPQPRWPADHIAVPAP